MQNLYSENKKTLLTEMEDLNKWRHIPLSLIRRFNVVKMPTPPPDWSINSTWIKISAAFSGETGKLILKMQRVQNSQNNLKEKKNRVDELILSDFYKNIELFID